MKKYRRGPAIKFVSVMFISLVTVPLFTGSASLERSMFPNKPSGIQPAAVVVEEPTRTIIHTEEALASPTASLGQETMGRSLEIVLLADSGTSVQESTQGESQAPEKPLQEIPTIIPKVTGKVAYLTFDDGPSAANTPKNLDTLGKYGIKATFFVLPHKGLDRIYKRMIEEGHLLGNHSYSHDYKLIYSSVETFRSDLLKAKAFLLDGFSYTTVLYRFPGGAMGKKPEIIDERKKVLDEEGYRYFDWSVSNGDCDTGSNGKDSGLMVKTVLDGARGKKKLIVLMHDTVDKKTTTEALPLIIEGLKKKGYEFDVLTNY